MQKSVCAACTVSCARLRPNASNWRGSGAKPIAVPLRAATWERAESEAAHWIATQHPALYGRVAFLRADDTTP